MVLAPGDGGAERARTRPSPCQVRHPSDAQVEWACRQVRRGETLERIFGDRWVDVARFNRIDRRHATQGVNLKVPARLDDIAGFTPMPTEYPDALADAKFILVDLSEQFLGAYEHGRLVLSVPAAVGEDGHETPAGEFRITAAHRQHQSSLYKIEDTEIPYPMNYALRFHVSRDGVGYWIHGRDMPGYPVSHGCIGLYDEEMQREYYRYPSDPVLVDAKVLYEWVLGPGADGGALHFLDDGPRVRIVGRAPAGS